MDISQYRELYVSEAQEHLDALNQEMLELEKDPTNTDIVNDIFRSAHTLKGMSATMGFERLTEVSHELENVLDALRSGELDPSAQVLDLLFACLDTISAMVSDIANEGDGEQDTSGITASLRALLEGEAPTARGRSFEHERKQEHVKKEEDKEEKGLEKEPEESKEELPENAEEPIGALEEGEGEEAAGEEEPNDTSETEEREDSKIEELKTRTEVIVEDTKEDLIEKWFSGSEKISEHERSMLKAIERKGAGAYHLRIALDPDCVLKSVRVFMVFKKLAQIGEVIKSNPSVEDLEDEKFERTFEILFASVEDVGSIERGLGNIAEIDSVEVCRIDPPKTLKEEGVGITEESGISKTGIETEPAHEEKHAQSFAFSPSRTQSVRVNIGRLDNLMNLVGELVINRTRLNEIAGKHEVTELKDALSQMARLTADLQDEVMKTRMVPVEQVFNRFPRMVRDLAKSQGKDVDFTIEGKEIELDRTILDEISDPLMHLLRNAVDHGIDSPENREKLGKPRRGTITLRARRDRNYVSIEVSDDGQGVDAQRIFKMALEKGVATPEEYKNNFNDDDMLRYLTAPGFSSAEEVSGVSGRGVGLDVVKGKVEALGGMLIMTSEKDKGTGFAMKLPLTLAIIQALLVGIADQIYAIPLGTVRETTVVSPYDIKKIKETEAIFLRNETIPLLRLERILGIPGGGSENGEPFPVVVVEMNVRSVALAVEELLGQQEIVITSLDKFLKVIKGFAGATILGTGKVALILDIPTLIF